MASEEIARRGSSSQASASVISRPHDRLGLGVIFAYNVPTIGLGYMFLLVNMYLMKFATDELLIAPSTMGLLFGLSRIWDAVTDPLAGYFSDRTNTRLGRRRPWILVSIVPIGLAFAMVWSPPLGLTTSSMVLWVGTGIFLFYSAMTIFVVPHTSLGAELSLDHHERTRIFGFRHVTWTLGSFAAVGGMALLIASADPRATASWLSWIVIAVTSLMLVGMVAGVREREEFRGRGEVSPYRAFRDVLRNPHAVLLLIIFLIESVGGATITVLTPYVSEYIVGRPEYTAYFIILYMIPSALSVPLWIWASRRLGKKQLWIFSTVAAALGFGAMIFVGEGSVMLISVLAAVLGLTSGAGAVVAPSIQADVIDYDELKTGQRKEGAYFAAWNFVYKLATGITLILTGIVLEAAGFAPNQAQTESAQTALRVLYALFPLTCYLVGAALLTRFRLDEREHARIRRELDAR
ncbi:MAG: hypothetical protein CBC48_20905 [bacterium TMED88]|nr:hypothetical protein [Deltaproteobacteria bacterium]OUV20794.1 MAG: hypothetical protein CBC48_20905 [bacterium TMED88]